MTKENEFSEGFALGVLMCGREELPTNKPMFELAFNRVWRQWSYSSTYPFVGARGNKDEIYQMTHAGVRRGTMHLYWEGLAVQARGEDDLNAKDIAKSINPEIPAEAWRELVEQTFRLFEDPTAVLPQ